MDSGNRSPHLIGKSVDILSRLKLGRISGTGVPCEVPFLQRKGVVPYETALAKHRVNLAIAPAMIESQYHCMITSILCRPGCMLLLPRSSPPVALCQELETELN